MDATPFVSPRRRPQRGTALGAAPRGRGQRRSAADVRLLRCLPRRVPRITFTASRQRVLSVTLPKAWEGPSSSSSGSTRRVHFTSRVPREQSASASVSRQPISSSSRRRSSDGPRNAARARHRGARRLRDRLDLQRVPRRQDLPQRRPAHGGIGIDRRDEHVPHARTRCRSSRRRLRHLERRDRRAVRAAPVFSIDSDVRHVAERSRPWQRLPGIAGPPCSRVVAAAAWRRACGALLFVSTRALASASRSLPSLSRSRAWSRSGSLGTVIGALVGYLLFTATGWLSSAGPRSRSSSSAAR